MATKNIKLTITVPSKHIITEIEFTAFAAEDVAVIPRRLPFADIANFAALKTAGYFRHATQTVSTELGGSATAGADTTLGFQLPPTEKLILLAKKKATTAETVTFKGSHEYSIPDLEVTIPSGAVGDIFEIDLFDMGLYVGSLNDTTISSGVRIVCNNAIELALIARQA